jgi:AraC-like DNA-binding protein
MLYIVGVIIAFFLAFILLSKKDKTPADKVLLAWLIVIGCHIGMYYCYLVSLEVAYPFLIGLAIPIPLMHGPFLFLYTIALTNPGYFSNFKWLWHFIPATGLYLYLIPFFMLPDTAKLEIARSDGSDYEVFEWVRIVIFIISGFGYTIWASVLLRQHKRNIVEQFSNTERISLQWLQYLIYGLGITWILVSWGNDEWIFGAATLFVLFIGYFGIKQVGIFTNFNNLYTPDYTANFDTKNTLSEVPLDVKPVLEEDMTKKKYQKSGLSMEQAEKLQHELAVLMQTEKLYKNPELTLADLALPLAVHPNYLSQMLNEKEGLSFYDYINKLRIEEFKRQIALPENRHYTLLTVAYDCGFNSKSSFNRYFRKVMEVSPSEYVQGLNLPVR